MLQRESRVFAPKTAGLLALALIFTAGSVLANADNPTADTKQKTKLIDLWKPGDAGERMNIRGRVTSLDGTPLAGIQVEIRQPDGEGFWTEQYRTVLTTDDQGRYQFGSVIPTSKFCGEPHVAVTVYQNGWEYFDDKLVFEEIAGSGRYYYGDGTQVFLEESNVRGEPIKFGRYDIVLSPD